MPSVFEKIKMFNGDRVPELVQLKYAAMAEDAFRFYRGSCHLFYEDLAAKQDWEDPTKAWICGDLHPENFGTYKGDNRVVYFDLNDFDEATLAPVTWEVARMLTGIFLAGHLLLLDKYITTALVKDYLDTYTQTLLVGKAHAVEKETATGLLKQFLRTVAARNEKELLKTRTETVKGRMRLRLDGLRLIPVSADLKKELKKISGIWLDEKQGKNAFKVLDIAGRIAGTGSIGLQRYVLLVLKEETGNHHLIDIKETRTSSVSKFIKLEQPLWSSDADRIISLQNRIQYVAPAWLHTLTFRNTTFVVKEMQPSQDRMDLRLCKGKKRKLADILDTMARLTAAGQLRSAGRQGSSNADDLIAFANSAKNWHKKILRYAEQTAAATIKQYQVYAKEYNREMNK